MRRGTRSRYRGRSAAVGLAVLAAAAGGTSGAPAAAEDGEPAPAGRVAFPTRCVPPPQSGLPPADGPTTAELTVDDPAPRVGDTVTVTYRVAATPAPNPLTTELPADVLTPTAVILLAGAQQGAVTVAGTARNDPVPAGAALPDVTMTGTFTVTAPGETSFAPGAYTLHTRHLLDLDTRCAPAAGEPPTVAGRLTASPLPAAHPRAGAPGGASGAPGAYTAIEPAPPAAGVRKVTATVQSGALSMTQAGASIALGAIPFGGGAAPGRIGTVTVTDLRGGPAGWTLTGTVTDFTGPGGVRIPGAELSWTPVCVTTPGSRGTCVAGSAGVVGPEGAVLARAPAAAGGGTFTVDATVTLRVPPYTRPGGYTAVLTLTLS
ncbi:beta-xylosidase [Streptomyces sp. NPDC006529]|uniref:beta-xylosidase n=1 Tax=Streptomyces sp. NPDC006529 TaxID=3157177 RepID=UPI0033A96D26